MINIITPERVIPEEVTPAGNDLQAVLNQVQPGQIIELPVEEFVGNFVLPAKGNGEAITIRTVGARNHLDRATPADAATMATLRSPNNLPALRAAAGARNWVLEWFRLTAGGATDILQLGTGIEANLTSIPSDFVLDQLLIEGNPTAKRGIALNCSHATVVGCCIRNVKYQGLETQGIACWNGPGPFYIHDNYIEAGSIGVLFGGARPSIDGLVPTDITFSNNHVTRPVEWRSQPWACKNLFELKNARNVSIQNNLFENNWPQAQSGFAIVFTVRAHGAPWSIVESVDFAFNTVRHSAAGFNILGRDDTSTSQVMRNVTIRDNTLEDISHLNWSGNGAWFLIGGGPENLRIRNNFCRQTGNIIGVSGPVCSGFEFTGNKCYHNSYGIFGNNVGTGNPAIAAYFPGSTITGNYMATSNPAWASRYPAGNFFPASLEGLE